MNFPKKALGGVSKYLMTSGFILLQPKLLYSLIILLSCSLKWAVSFRQLNFWGLLRPVLELDLNSGQVYFDLVSAMEL